MPFIINKKRTTLSLPADATDEEIIESISNAMGISKEQVPPLNKEDALAKVRRQREQVEQIKAPFNTLLTNSQGVQLSKFDELDDIGRFIYFANNTHPITSLFKLEVPQALDKFPDFTLRFNEKKIGVEHTRLIMSDHKAVNVMVNHCLEKAERTLAKDLSGLSKTINVFFDYSKAISGIGNFYDRNFSSAEKERVGNLIVNYIQSKLTGGTEAKPEFIEKIDVISNSKAEIDMGLGQKYTTLIDFSSILSERIKKKEEKATNYRNAAPVDLLWLLIVVDDLNGYAGFNLESPFIPQITASNFDCIIIFEKFGGEMKVLFHKTA